MQVNLGQTKRLIFCSHLAYLQMVYLMKSKLCSLLHTLNTEARNANCFIDSNNGSNFWTSNVKSPWWDYKVNSNNGFPYYVSCLLFLDRILLNSLSSSHTYDPNTGIKGVDHIWLFPILKSDHIVKVAALQLII